MNNIFYEITPISESLLTLIRMNERYDPDETNDKDLITLKINNIKFSSWNIKHD